MRMAIQQLYVRLQQFQGTLETILQEAWNELVVHVPNATSTTTHEEPMKRADRLFKLRSYLEAVDQRNELEPAMTEESSTPRLNRALSTQMYYILVMMKTLCRCRNTSASEEFAGRRQFVREWEPRFVGLLRNVLSCRRKDDIPTQLPVDEVLTHESQSSKSVMDDIMTDVNVLRMENGRVEACLIWESTGNASCIQVRKEILENTRTQQYTDSNLVPVQIGVQPKSKGKSKHGKDARIKSSEKVKDDDRRKCYYCREAGHTKSQSSTRLKDLADAEEKPVTANSRPSSTAADAPLADDHVTTFLVTVPHVKRKPPCACVKIETTMRSDAGSTAPTGSERVRLTSAISTCETCLVTDTRAGGGICPRGSDQTAQRDTTVTTTQFVTALDDSAHGNVDETHFESHKFQVQCNEADVCFSISSAGKTLQQGDWFESDGGYQVMLPGPGEQTRTCAKDSNVAKLQENRRVYWLPGSAAESTDGAPLSMKFRVAWLVVEATPNSETDFDVNTTQLEESEETRRLKHKTLPRHVSKDGHDARQIAHLQSRSRSGETVDHAHRPQAGKHEGEDRRGKGSSLLDKRDRSTARESSLISFGVGSSIFSHVGGQS